MGAEYGRAGTKRISNLVHSEKWQAGLIEDFLWQAGTQRVEEMGEQGEPPLVIWDESVLEKPESLQAEGLWAVRSTKAVRLKRIKPGYFNPPGGRPIFVPGFHWLQVLVVGPKGSPTLAHMRWWTTRGEQKSLKRTEERAVLAYIDGLWGKEVLHIWDRGFAGNPWLTQVFLHGARFVLRWPKNYQLLDEHEQLRKPGEISKGKRSWEHRLLWDARRRCERKTGVIAFPVFEPTHHQPLWLVIARRKGQSPWYLLTSEPAHTPHRAWQIVLAYARRWQVEMAIRYNKCELAFEISAISAGQALLGQGLFNVHLMLRDGSSITFPLNRGRLEGRRSFPEIVSMGEPRSVSDITSIEFEYRGAHATHLFDLTINVLLKQDHDPFERWVGYYLEALRVMGGRGIAFGTDFNGLSPQIPFTDLEVEYPTHPVEVGIAGANVSLETWWAPKSLDRCQSLDKIWDFHNDGLAHYGMLPDFFQALSQDARIGNEQMKPLFLGAEAFVQMWERVERSAHFARIRMTDGEGGPIVHLYSWYGTANSDNFTTSHPEWAGRPGDETEAYGGYRCFRIEGAAFSPHYDPPSGTIPLNLFWSNEYKDHVLTTSPRVDLGVNLMTGAPSSYRGSGIAGYIFPPDQPQPTGTIPLYRWHSNTTKDHLTTTDPAWAGSASMTRSIAGNVFRFVRLEGYVIAPLTGLYSWWHPDGADNFATTQEDWTGFPGYQRDGYKFYRTEGRIFRPDLPPPSGTVPVWLWWHAGRHDNFLTADPAWDPASGGDHLGYNFGRVLGFIFPPNIPQPVGTVPLFHWFSGEREDNFATSDPNWDVPFGTVQGYEFVRKMGYIYLA